jgi:hypothetical protein
MNKERRHEIANALDAFFTDPSKWKKGGDMQAPCCLGSAGTLRGFDHREVALALGFKDGGPSKVDLLFQLYEWNDAPERTFEDIKQRIREARQ